MSFWVLFWPIFSAIIAALLVLQLGALIFGVFWSRRLRRRAETEMVKLEKEGFVPPSPDIMEGMPMMIRMDPNMMGMMPTASGEESDEKPEETGQYL